MTKTCNRRHFISIHFHYYLYPISMAQGFLSFFLFICIPFYSVLCNSRETQQNKNEQCNYSLKVDNDGDDDDCMYTKLDNRNAISIRNNKANTRKQKAYRNKARKKIGAIFVVVLLPFCISYFSQYNILNGFMAHFVYCYSFFFFKKKFFNHHNK